MHHGFYRADLPNKRQINQPHCADPHPDPPLQKTRFVVRRGKVCRRLKRICPPNFETVPVPVRSALSTPVLMTSSISSRYCVKTVNKSQLLVRDSLHK